MLIKICNVAIPLDLNDDFIPPDLEKAFDYYPNFLKYSKRKISANNYMNKLMKHIDKEKPNGYDGDKAVKEFISWYGGLFKFIDDYLTEKK